MQYRVILDADEEGGATQSRFPALPGCISEGATRSEALENIREAILGFMAGLEKVGEAVLLESQPVGLETISI